MNDHSVRIQRYLVPIVMAAFLASCSKQAPIQVSSTIDTGHPIISFPNRDDHVGTTIILSNPNAQQAGIDGRAFTLSTVDMSEVSDELVIDMDGNMGIRGTYHSLSSRSAKADIRGFNMNATGLLAHTRIVTFRYRGEPVTSYPHVGIIAEDSSYPITDQHHRSFDLNSSIAVTMKAEQELDHRVLMLEAEINQLRAEIRKSNLAARPHL